MRRGGQVLGAAAALSLLSPAVASAHGLVGRQDLPIPRWLFAWAASVVLVVSFVALATLWPKPRLEAAVEGRRLFAVPRLPAEIVLGALGVFAFGLTVYAGLAGTQTETANLAPTFVYVVFWVGFPVLSLLFGDVFRAVNPWRAVGRICGTVTKRLGGDATPEPLPYPAWLGRWPAAAGILAYAWVELVYSARTDPSQVAVMMLVYATIQLVGMSLYGVQVWTERGDAFAVVFGLFGSMSVLHADQGVVRTRPPLSGLPALRAIPGTVALLVVMIGTTSFDGFSQGPTWSSVAPHLQDAFGTLGFAQGRALEAAFTVGLIAVVLIIGGLYRLGIAGMRSVGGTARGKELASLFVHTLVPIALAYVIAHYASLLLYQGQAMAYLLSDPLGNGADYLGAGDRGINYTFISATGIWYVQVAALVLGHVSGLVLAHDRALVLYAKPRDATRSQYWMLAIMVGFTSLGLWLLSAQSQ
jgi:hypothetical protein